MSGSDRTSACCARRRPRRRGRPDPTRRVPGTIRSPRAEMWRRSCAATGALPARRNGHAVDDERGRRIVIVGGDSENPHLSIASSATRRPAEIGVQPRGSRRRPVWPSRRRAEQKEIEDRENGGAQHVGDRDRDTQVSFPQPAPARQPHLPSVRLRQDAGQLRVCVVHVEHFIAQDLFEDRARLRIVVHESR